MGNKNPPVTRRLVNGAYLQGIKQDKEGLFPEILSVVWAAFLSSG